MKRTILVVVVAAGSFIGGFLSTSRTKDEPIAAPVPATVLEARAPSAPLHHPRADALAVIGERATSAR